MQYLKVIGHLLPNVSDSVYLEFFFFKEESGDDMTGCPWAGHLKYYQSSVLNIKEKVAFTLGA